MRWLHEMATFPHYMSWDHSAHQVKKLDSFDLDQGFAALVAANVSDWDWEGEILAEQTHAFHWDRFVEQYRAGAIPLDQD